MNFGIGIIWTVVVSTASVVGVYFTNQTAIAQKVNDAKTEFAKDISSDRQDIATLKEAVNTLKENSTETRNDVKEILKFLKPNEYHPATAEILENAPLVKGLNKDGSPRQ